MPDENTTPVTTDEPNATEGEQPVVEPKAPEGEKPAEEPKEGENPEDLPTWARSALTSANAEAANYRVQLREAQAALGKAKTVEEFEAATATLNEKVGELESALAKATVARKYELPDALAKVLTGKTPEELDAHGKALAALIEQTVTEPEHLSGGLDPADSDGSFDPVKTARAARARRY